MNINKINLSGRFLKLLQFFMFLFMIILVTTSAISSQEVIMEETFEEKDFFKEYGPNRKKFSHSYVSIGFPVFFDMKNTVSTDNFLSVNFQFGNRWKRKINNLLSAGYDVRYERVSLRISQLDEKEFPSPVLHDKEKITKDILGGEIYLRINAGKRGDYLGKYLDLGSYFNYNFITRHVTVDEVDRGEYTGEKRKQVFTKIPFMQNYEYGLSARLGFNKILIYSKY
ncbi:MAG: hypothetical protein ACOC2F_05365, partial [Bacteroidota bacterium]